MLIHQNGIRVVGARGCGLALFTYVSILMMGAVSLLIYSFVSNSFSETTLAGVIINLTQAFAISWPATFLIWMFPDIELRPDKIKLKFLIFRSEISKQRIIKITDRRGMGVKAIFVKRGGMILNTLYGLFYFNLSNQPVVLLSLDDKSLSYLSDFLKDNSD